MEKETKIILKAKKEYGLDFENPKAMAQQAEMSIHLSQYGGNESKKNQPNGTSPNKGKGKGKGKKSGNVTPVKSPKKPPSNKAANMGKAPFETQ